MPEKTNIWRRFWQIARWVLLSAYLLVVLGMVHDKRHSLPCRAVATSIEDSALVHFVTRDAVNEQILKSHGAILGMPISRVVTEDIELRLLENPFIASGEVYKDIEGVLHVKISQRQPLVRILRNGKPDIYIDRTGLLLSASPAKPVYLLIANGNIPVPAEFINRNVHELPEGHLLQGIYTLAQYIHSSDFWNHQIEQIFVDRTGEIWLTPRIGAHRILIGNPDRIEWKMRKLYLLYTHGLNNLGWNQYETINLKYSNQVICVKRKY